MSNTLQLTQLQEISGLDNLQRCLPTPNHSTRYSEQPLSSELLKYYQLRNVRSIRNHLTFLKIKLLYFQAGHSTVERIHLKLTVTRKYLALDILKLLTNGSLGTSPREAFPEAKFMFCTGCPFHCSKVCLLPT